MGNQSNGPQRSTKQADCKYGYQGSDPQRSTEQANCKYGSQSSDPSKEVIHKDLNIDNLLSATPAHYCMNLSNGKF